MLNPVDARSPWLDADREATAIVSPLRLVSSWSAGRSKERALADRARERDPSADAGVPWPAQAVAKPADYSPVGRACALVSGNNISMNFPPSVQVRDWQGRPLVGFDKPVIGIIGR